MNIEFFTYYLCESSEQHCQCNAYLSYVSIINTMLCSHRREKEREKIKKEKERNRESSSELSCIKRLSEFTSIFSKLMHWLCLYQLTVEFCIQLIDLTHVPRPHVSLVASKFYYGTGRINVSTIILNTLTYRCFKTAHFNNVSLYIYHSDLAVFNTAMPPGL